MTTAEQQAVGQGATPPRSIADDLRSGRDELRSLGGYVGELADDLRGLAAAESWLARAEMQDSASAFTRAATFGVAALVIGMIGAAFIFRTVMAGFEAAGLAEWAAALLTAVLALAIAGGLGFVAKRQLTDFTVVPKRTIAAVKEDMAWVREQTKRNSA